MANNMVILALALILGAIGILLLINFTPLYEFGCCTFNLYECDCDCPDAEECDPVRECGGYEENPLECFAKYCWRETEVCYPHMETEGLYRCACKNIQDAPI